MKKWSIALCVLSAAVVATFCYFRPTPDDFDRYMYEALARQKTQTWPEVYPIVKHENRRAEESSVMDSAEHMAQLEPLYAIRPLYIELISATHSMGLSYQRSIAAISALSLLGIALLALSWTRQPFYCLLLIMIPQMLDLGRLGTPDALNALLLIGALFALIVHDQITVALGIMLAATWVRTDSVIALLCVVAWLVYQRRLQTWVAVAVCAIGGASVAVINDLSGNYGYRVLFRYSFIGGRYPSQIQPVLSSREYFSALAHNLPSLLPQAAVWVLLALLAWRLHSRAKTWLIPVSAAAALHFALYPSPEARYLAWFYAFAGILLIDAIPQSDFGLGNLALHSINIAPMKRTA